MFWWKTNKFKEKNIPQNGAFDVFDKKMNSGLLERPQDQLGSDYIVGRNSPLSFKEELASGNWNKYKPNGEKQRYKLFESMGCTGFADLNVVEFQINRFILEDIINVDLINDWIGSDGLFDGSDRGVNKEAGTTENGNYLNNPAEAVRTQGIIPQQEWPNEIDGHDFNWSEWYKEIPKEIIDKGKKLLDYFEFNYEWLPVDNTNTVNVETIKHHLKHCPITIASATCDGWASLPIIPACSAVSNHATAVFNVEDGYIEDFDTYNPYSKKLVSNYRITSALKIIVTPKPIILKNNNNFMKYVNIGIEQYLIDETLKIALNIGDETELELLKKQGLTGNPEAMVNLDGYVIYPLVQKGRLKDLFGL